MITTFKELKTYISMDLNNSGRTYKTKIDYFRDEISRYLIYLRIREYVYNKNKIKFNLFYKVINHILRKKIYRLGVKLGFDLSINSNGMGLRIDHYGFLAINEHAKIGKNCHIWRCNYWCKGHHKYVCTNNW